MKNVCCFLLFCICAVFSAHAQYSLGDQYYIERAKRELKKGLKDEILTVLAEVDASALVIGTKDGVLSYVIADGFRKVFNVEPEEECPLYWRPPYLPPRPAAGAKNKNDFAELLQALYKEKWRVKQLGVTEDKEVYFLEKQL